MQLIKSAESHREDAHQQRRFLRLGQADQFEMLAATSEAEGIGAIWIAEHVSQTAQVRP